MTFSENIARLRPSATIAVSSLAKELRAEGRDVIDLSAGEPDFDTPEWICDAAVKGIRDGHTRYTPAAGTPALRGAVAAAAQARAAEGWQISADGVVVTSGAKQALFNACFALFGPGDEVLVASPYWTSYPEIVGLARAEPVFVSGPEERGFRLSPAELEAARTERTRGLILCSPSNPTGSVYPEDELGAVVDWAREQGIWLLSDEIYRRIRFANGGEAAPAPGLLDFPRDRLGPWVLIDGLSKSHAMTGWRVGFSITDPEVARKLAALQSHTTSNASTPSQMAALEAVLQTERSDDEIRAMLRAFRRRRDLVTRRIRERLPHLSFVEPDGAFYLFVRVDAEYGGAIDGSEAWCSDVLGRTGVALVPGIAFGDDRYARLSYATSDELLDEAIRRLAER